MPETHESPGRPDLLAEPGTRAIWPIQLMHLGAIALVVLVWELYVPLLVELPAELLVRVRGYALYLAPVVLGVLVLNYFWLRPVSRQWPAVVRGELDPKRAAGLMRRAVGYPYLAFGIVLAGAVITAVVIALVQLGVHATPSWKVVELLLLALAMAVVAALLLFLIGRLATAPWLRSPRLDLPRLSWEPDLRKRLVLVVVCVALIAWLVMGVQAADALLSSAEGRWAWAVLSGLAWGGLACLVLLGVGAWAAAGSLSEGPRKLAERMDRLAADMDFDQDKGAQEPVAHELRLPVASADEIGDLAAAFNRFTERTVQAQAELWQSAQQASQAEDRQAEFLATVSSALRTPLHSIIGFSELLLEEVDGPLSEAQAEDVRSVRKGGHHLLSLVDDLVDLTRIDTGNLALNMERVELGRVIADALDAASGLRRHRPVELVHSVAADVPAVRADEIRLRQILFNLVGNALKFTEQGEIRVRAERVGATLIRVTVQDSGPGIPAESLERVFVEFEQIRDRSGERKQGTGLGLAITRRLVELHGGHIEARNRDEGGAEFAFQLRVWED